MDKIVGLCITIFVGLPLTIVSMVISWWMDDDRDIQGLYTGEHGMDSDVRIYVPVRCRNRRRNNRHDMEGDK